MAWATLIGVCWILFCFSMITGLASLDPIPWDRCEFGGHRIWSQTGATRCVKHAGYPDLAVHAFTSSSRSAR